MQFKIHAISKILVELACWNDPKAGVRLRGTHALERHDGLKFLNGLYMREIVCFQHKVFITSSHNHRNFFSETSIHSKLLALHFPSISDIQFQMDGYKTSLELEAILWDILISNYPDVELLK